MKNDPSKLYKNLMARAAALIKEYKSDKKTEINVKVDCLLSAVDELLSDVQPVIEKHVKRVRAELLANEEGKKPHLHTKETFEHYKSVLEAIAELREEIPLPKNRE